MGATAALRIAPMSAAVIRQVELLEDRLLQMPQAPIGTAHLIHAGMYARTILIPAGVMLTGALIKRATVLIVSGDADIITNDGPGRLTGYHVVPASANRKQAFYARSDTHLTMIFPTEAKTLPDAENEFTDEAVLLMSRANPDGDTVVITGE